MHRFVLAPLFALALATTTFATSIDAGNSGGTLSGSTSGMTLTGSTLISIGLSGGTPLTGNLGTVSFSTGALATGSLANGGTFAPGGSFTITGNGTGGIPNGVIFTGQFTGPVVWARVDLANGTHNYTLTGALEGQWFSGITVDGATIQLTVNTGDDLFEHSAGLSSGNTNLNGKGIRTTVTPEPTSLSLMGAGLLGLVYGRKRILLR